MYVIYINIFTQSGIRNDFKTLPTTTPHDVNSHLSVIFDRTFLINLNGALMSFLENIVRHSGHRLSPLYISTSKHSRQKLCSQLTSVTAS